MQRARTARSERRPRPLAILPDLPARLCRLCGWAALSRRPLVAWLVVLISVLPQIATAAPAPTSPATTTNPPRAGGQTSNTAATAHTHAAIITVPPTSRHGSLTKPIGQSHLTGSPATWQALHVHRTLLVEPGPPPPILASTPQVASSNVPRSLPAPRAVLTRDGTYHGILARQSGTSVYLQVSPTKFLEFKVVSSSRFLLDGKRIDARILSVGESVTLSARNGVLIELQAQRLAVPATARARTRRAVASAVAASGPGEVNCGNATFPVLNCTMLPYTASTIPPDHWDISRSGSHANWATASQRPAGSTEGFYNDATDPTQVDPVISEWGDCSYCGYAGTIVATQTVQIPTNATLYIQTPTNTTGASPCYNGGGGQLYFQLDNDAQVSPNSAWVPIGHATAGYHTLTIGFYIHGIGGGGCNSYGRFSFSATGVADEPWTSAPGEVNCGDAEFPVRNCTMLPYTGSFLQPDQWLISRSGTHANWSTAPQRPPGSVEGFYNNANDPTQAYPVVSEWSDCAYCGYNATVVASQNVLIPADTTLYVKAITNTTYGSDCENGGGGQLYFQLDNDAQVPASSGWVSIGQATAGYHTFFINFYIYGIGGACTAKGSFSFSTQGVPTTLHTTASASPPSFFPQGAQTTVISGTVVGSPEDPTFASTPLTVTTTIANSSGTTVRTLDSGSHLPSNHWLWDGTDSNGALVVPGTYTAVVQATAQIKGHTVTGSASVPITVLADGPIPPPCELGVGTTGGPNSATNPEPQDDLAGVNTQSGNFNANQQDMQGVPAGARLGLEWTRYYNSTCSGTGPFGPGWTFTYYEHLNITGGGGSAPSTTVVHTLEDGQQVTYTNPQFQSTGVYSGTYLYQVAGSGGATYPKGQAPSGDDLIFDPNNSAAPYKVSYCSHGCAAYFNGGGQLVALTDPHSPDAAHPAVTLTYTGNGLTRVTDSMGQSLTVTSDSGSGLISAMQDPAGDTWHYFYTNGYLTGVQMTDGTTTHYTYGTAQQLLTQIQDAVGGTTTIGYNGSGQATSVTDPLNNTTAFNYTGGPTGTSGTGPITATVVTNPLGGVQDDYYDSHYRLRQSVDPAGLSAQEDVDAGYHATGSVLTGAQGTLRTDSSYDSNGDQLSSVDGLGNFTTNSFDALGDLTGHTDQRGFASTYGYDAQGDLLTSTDALGNVSTAGYDANGNQTSSVDALGRITTYAYDQYGNQTNVTDPLGNTTHTTYDALGHVLSTTDAQGRTTRHGYDSLGRTIAMTDALGNVTSYGYDALGRTIAVTDALGGVTRSRYDTAGHLLATTDPLGNITTYGYDSLGRTIAVTDTLGNVTRSSYDGDGRLVDQYDALGVRTVHNVYDSAGQLIERDDALGGKTTYQYDLGQRLLIQTDPLGHSTSYGYDALGRTIAVTDAAGNVTQTAYDGNGRVLQQADALGNVTTYGYDALGETIAVTDAAGDASRSQYDANGRLLTSTDPLGKATAYGYDALGRTIAVTDPLGNVTRSGYDADGRLISSTDALGNTTLTGYDALGRTIAVTDALGDVTHSRYDADGRLTGSTDALGNTTLSGYDALGRTIAVTDPLGNASTSRYDADGRLVTSLDPLGNATAYGYDALGRTIAVTDAVGGVTSSGYDAASRLVTSTDPLGHQTTYSYDPVGRQLTRKDATGQVWRTSYDADGRTLSSGDPLGDTAGYLYDAVGRTIAVTDALGNVTTSQYDAAGHLITSTDPLQNQTVYAYDASGRQITLTDALGHTSTSGYDADGRLVTSTDALRRVTLTGYDALGRTIAVTDPLGNVTHSGYDAGGRLVTSTDPLGNVTLTGYDALGHTIAVTDALGGVTTSQYDAAGRLVTSTDPLRHQTLYGYDPLGRTIAVTDANGHVTTSQYDLAGHLMSSADGTGATTRYGYDPVGRQITSTDPLGNLTSRQYDAAGRLLTTTDPLGHATGYLYDALGRTLQVTDATGRWTGNAYDAAGRLVQSNDGNNDLTTTQYDALGHAIVVTDGAGRSTTSGYDAAGELVTSADGLGDATRYGYDAGGRQITMSDPLGRTTLYTYDANARLTATSDPAGDTAHYGYDALGHTVTITDPNGHVSTKSYDLAGRLLSSSDPLHRQTSYGYDALGNTVAITDGNIHLASTTYDVANRPLVTSYADGSYVQRTYDAAGRQLTLDTQDAQVTWAYDAASRTTDLTETVGGLGAAPLTRRSGGAMHANAMRLPTVPQSSSPVSGAGPSSATPWNAPHLPSTSAYGAATGTATPFGPGGPQGSSGGNPPGWVPFATATNTPAGGLIPFPPATSATGAASLPTGTATGTPSGNAQLLFPTATAGAGNAAQHASAMGAAPRTQALASTSPQALASARQRGQITANGAAAPRRATAAGQPIWSTGSPPGRASGPRPASGNGSTAPTAGTTPSITPVATNTPAGAPTTPGTTLPPASATASATTADDALPALPTPSATATARSAIGKASASASYGQLPLSFEPNVGQADPHAAFLAHGSGYTLFLTADQAVLALRPPAVAPASSRGALRAMPAGIAAGANPAQPAAAATPSAGTVLRLQLTHANPRPRLLPGAPLPGLVSYLIGNDPHRWHTAIRTFGQVTEQDVYPGIDLVYHGQQGQLEYDFVVHPGASAGAIGWTFAGTRQIRLDAQGTVLLSAGGATLRQRVPHVYQQVGHARRAIAAHLALRADGTIGIVIAAYDHRQALVIDPTLIYSTYLGGSGADLGNSIAVDSAGSAYVTGYTSSSDFPLANAYQGTRNGLYDVFVSKLNPGGNALVYSTYLGGSGNDYGQSIAMDGAGDAYVAGFTTSTNFPTTAGALQSSDPAPNGGYVPFVTKLSANGSSLAYSTYLDGSGTGYGSGIAVDSAGDAYVVGYTNSTNFPTTANAFQTSNAGSYDLFVSKLNPSGSALVYSTYLGGSATDNVGGIATNDVGHAIAVDSAGDAYVTGYTSSSNFPTTANALQRSSAGGVDAFVSKLNPTGSALVYSTYLGGSNSDVGNSVAVDSAGDAFVAGFTGSTNFPTTANAFQRSNAGATDVFVSKLNPSGSALIYSTYLGGSTGGFGEDVAVTSAGNAVVVGWGGANFPVVSPLQATGNGFVSVLSTDGSSLVFSTRIQSGWIHSVALDSASNIYVAGYASGNNLPVLNAVQSTYGGGSYDAFVSKMSFVPPAPATMHLHYTYDAANRRTSLTYADGTSATWGYDAAGRVNALTQPGGGNWTVTHDGAGNLTSLSAPNGGNESWGYDGAGRLTSSAWTSGSTTLFSQTATLDAAGQRTTLQDSWGTTTDGYDSAGRLTSAAYPDGSGEQDSYDAAGNRTVLATTTLSGTVTATNQYDAADQLTSSAVSGQGTTTFSYDGNGNQLGSSGPTGIVTNTYNLQNQLVHITGPATNVSYVYDGQGDRLRSLDQTGLTPVLHNDAQDLVGGLSSLTSDGQQDYLYLTPGDGSAPLIGYNQTTTRATYLASDLLGSVRLATDPSNATIGAAGYDAWGNARPYPGATGPTLLADLQGSSPFGYAGQYYDAGPGTYGMRAREYSPQQGRFLSEDPLAPDYQVPVTIDPYEYAGNMPTDVTDPSGRGWVLQPRGSNDDVYEADIQGQIKLDMQGTSLSGYTTEYNVPVYSTKCNQPLHVYNAGIVSLSADHTKGYFWDLEHVQAYAHQPGPTAIANGVSTHLALPLLQGTFIDWGKTCGYNRVSNPYGGDSCADVQHSHVSGLQPGPDYVQYFGLGQVNTQTLTASGQTFNVHAVSYQNDPWGRLATWAEPSQAGLVLYDLFHISPDCKSGNILTQWACAELASKVGPGMGPPHPDEGSSSTGVQGVESAAVSGEVREMLALENESREATLEEDLSRTRSASEEVPGCSTCFAAGTRVALPTGSKAIQDLRVGERVLAEDPQTGKVQAEAVQAVIDDGVKPLIELVLADGSTIRVTSNHYFWVDSGARLDHAGWLQAGQLELGDRLRTASGIDVTVVATHWNVGEARVYTLTVNTDHTFFVGGDRVLVHNADGLICPTVPGFDEQAAVASAQRALRRLYSKNTYGRSLAATERGPIYASGGSGGVGAYVQAQAEVEAEAQQLGIDIPAHTDPRYDAKFPYYTTHAEQYASVLEPNEPIGSIGIPCTRGCRPWFVQLAAKRNFPQVVADPTGTFVFYPNAVLKRIYNVGTEAVGHLSDFAPDGSHTS